MRSFQRELRNSLPVPAKNVREFPAYWGYNGQLYYSAGRFRFGLTGGLNSTGARTTYADYSGSISYDHLAKVVRVGVGADYRLSGTDAPWESWFSLQLERGATKYNLSSRLILDGTTLSEEDLDFKARHIFLHPAFVLRKDLTPALFVSANLGFLFDSSAFLEYSEDTELLLLNNKNDPIGLQWTGWRLGVSGGIKF